MKKVLFFVVTFIMFPTLMNVVNAQDNGLFVPKQTKERKPIKFQNVRESDVQWTKTIWRWVDLTENANLALYYPIEPTPRRKSLIQIIMDGLENSSIKAYETDEFDNKKTYSITKVKQDLGAEDKEVRLKDEYGGDSVDANGDFVTKPVHEEAKLDQVKVLIVKEIWYFDKQRSVMDVRIVGFRFVRLYKKQGDTKYTPADLFWVKYSDARAPMVHNKIYTRGNQVASTTFDDFFLKRQFDGYVFQEDNVYGNRRVNEYKAGIEVLLESKKILKKVYDYEHQVWEF